MVEIQGICKNYHGKKVLSGVGLSIVKGQIISIVGCNGSGKSTLFKIVAGLAKATQGRVIFKNGVFCNAIIETPSFFGALTGTENLRALLGETYNKRKAAELFSIFELGDSTDIKVKKYSLGMKQKLAIIYMFLSNAKVLLLDEPTNALDQVALRIFRDLLLRFRNEGKSIIIASHNISYINAISDKIYSFRDGRLYLEDNKTVALGNGLNHIFCVQNIEDAIKYLTKESIIYDIAGDEILIRIDIAVAGKLFCALEQFVILSYRMADV
jgi:ABC-2 type transport system ATP-binding protein